MVYYLKVNRDVDYSFRNLQHWLKIISIDDSAICFIICDNQILNKKICEIIACYSIKVSVIPSYYGEREKKLIENIANAKWRKAGLAHLTTFMHAIDNSYDSFWNIDADDTMMCIDENKANNLLKKVEEYARKHGIDVFSLDMWRSQSRGNSWSFGITYTNAKLDWIEVMCSGFDYKGREIDRFVNRKSPKNIDEFFSYLKEKRDLVSIETFCVENLLFIHYSDDFLYYPIQSGVYYWKDGKVIFPILLSVFGSKSLGCVDIADDIITIYAGVAEHECQYYLARVSNYTFECGNVLDAREFDKDNKELFRITLIKRMEKMIEHNSFDGGVFLWGCNDIVRECIQELKSRNIKVLGILDNNPSKQGVVVSGVEVFSPELLKDPNNKNASVIVLIKHYRDVCFQMERYGCLNTPYWLTDCRLENAIGG